MTENHFRYSLHPCAWSCVFFHLKSCSHEGCVSRDVYRIRCTVKRLMRCGENSISKSPRSSTLGDLPHTIGRCKHIGRSLSVVNTSSMHLTSLVVWWKEREAGTKLKRDRVGVGAKDEAHIPKSPTLRRLTNDRLHKTRNNFPHTKTHHITAKMSHESVFVALLRSL